MWVVALDRHRQFAEFDIGPQLPSGASVRRLANQSEAELLVVLAHHFVSYRT